MRMVLAAAIMFWVSAAAADEVTIGIWNVSQGTLKSVTRRSDQLARLRDELKRVTSSRPPLMVLEEVTSFAAAEFIAKALGYDSGTVAVSDAGSDREIWPFALEVAIITTLPVVSVTAFKSKPDPKSTPFLVDIASNKVTNGVVQKLIVPVVSGIDDQANVPRAVLRLELQGGVVVYGVHLNSSGLGFCRLDDQKTQAENLAKTADALGLSTEASAVRNAVDRVKAEIGRAESPGIEATSAETFRRAATREAAAAAIVRLAESDVANGKRVFVGGDFNTPLQEKCKTGGNLAEDFTRRLVAEPPPPLTPAVTLMALMIRSQFSPRGWREEPVFGSLQRESGIHLPPPAFVDSPIDNVLIAGSDAEFVAHKLVDPMGSKPFGSDHHPVVLVPRR